MFRIADHILFVAAVLMAGSLGLAQSIRLANPADACSVVSKSEASFALGSPAGAMSKQNVGPSSNCTIKGSKGTAVIVTSFPYSSVGDARDAYKMLIKQSVAHLGGSGGRVNGVGDEANQTAGFVYARKGAGVYVFNVVTTASAGARLAKETALAKSALSRMP